MKKYYRRGDKTRLYLIVTLIVILITSVGYAIFTEQLEISGTVSGSANFRVYFTEATVTESTKGTATINSDADTVTFTTNLTFPGDRVQIATKIKNESSIAVKLNDFSVKKVVGTNKVDIDSSADIRIDYEPIDTSTEILQPNGICDYRFVIYWDSYENQTVTSPDSQTFEISLNYQQNATAPELETLHTHGQVPIGGGEMEDPPVTTYTWIQNGTTVTNNEGLELEVGSSITGYEANGVSSWWVLGAENGKLLITTNTCPETVALLGRDGYTNGIATLNAVAATYTNSTYADRNARSINADDINRVTGYDPTTYEGATYYYEEMCGLDCALDAYGNEVTYSWQGTDYPYYLASNGLTGSLRNSHSSGFYYPTASGFTNSAKSATAATENKELITTLTNTYYWYDGSSQIDSAISAYTLLFANTGTNPGATGSYWLGSQYIHCFDDAAYFGLRSVNDDSMGDVILARSYEDEGNCDMGLRPVVSLKSTIEVTSAGAISVN